MQLSVGLGAEVARALQKVVGLVTDEATDATIVMLLMLPPCKGGGRQRIQVLRLLLDSLGH